MLDHDSSPTEIQEKYAAERDRRIRSDANDQFVAIEGDFSYFAEDPYGDEVAAREPLTDFTEVIVIGGGFGGLLQGARLRQQGYTDIRMVEKGSDFGGTWYWNRYPGVQCDIESYIYLPLLEETGFMPSHKYAFGDEIRRHCVGIAEHFGLYDNAVFGTAVTSVEWDETDQLWTVHTAEGDAMRARFVCMANGPLNRAKLPGVPGIDTFKGHTFHTSRWDYDYTGGNADGGLDKLADKRVAVIGTGATALQCVPHVGASAQHLYVVQRTPSAVDERNNSNTDPEWVESLEPGWQQKRIDNFISLMSNRPEEENLVNDMWTDMVRRMRTSIVEGLQSGEITPADIPAVAERADFESMQAIRDRAARLVEDPDVAEALKPYYRKLCKRPAFHDEFLPTFNRPNVTLVDTAGQGVERFTDTGFVVNGEEFEVDCIIFATGFEVGTSYTRRAGYEVIGAEGVTLSEKWAEAPSTLYGMQTAGFPNLFFLGTVQGTTGLNITQTLDEQSQHIGHIMGRALEVGATRVEVDADAERAWVERVMTSGREVRQSFFGDCTPGYYNGEGADGNKGGFWQHEYAGTPLDFFELLRDYRSVSHLPGVVVDGAALEPTAEDRERLGSPESVAWRLQPEMRRLTEQLAMGGGSGIGSVPASDIRAMMEFGAQMRGPGPELLSVEDATATHDGVSVPVRIYRDTDAPSAVVFYCHGGGWVVGSVNEFDAPMRKLAKKSGAVVVSVEYRLAPEHPFPAAYDDASAALAWVDANRGDLAAGADTPIFVAGDSAGANLVSAVSLQARDAGSVDIAGQILIYPCVSGECDTPRFDAFIPPILKKEDTQWFFDQYVPDTEMRTDLRLAPLLADSHAGLPPALIVTAEHDLLRPDGELYRDALEAAGVPVDYYEYLGSMHAFFSVGDGTTMAANLTARIAEFVNRT